MNFPPAPPLLHPVLNRRTALQAGAIGLLGLGMNHLDPLRALAAPAPRIRARSVTFGELYATLYRNLGIDLNTTTIQDLNGRPQYLVEDNAQPMRELIS